jgi:hypothetical protein
VNDTVGAEAAAEAGYIEVGEMAASDGQVTVEFIGFEALPEIQTSLEAGTPPATPNPTSTAELLQPDHALAPVPSITTYLESVPPLQLAGPKLQLMPQTPAAEPVEADDSFVPVSRLRRGTTAYIANHWEQAA